MELLSIIIILEGHFRIMSDFDKELDTSGLNCPLPIIKAKKDNKTAKNKR